MAEGYVKKGKAPTAESDIKSGTVREEFVNVLGGMPPEKRGAEVERENTPKSYKESAGV